MCFFLAARPPTKKPKSSTTSVPFTCAPPMVMCKGSYACIYPNWVCDNMTDCADGSDEKDCPTKTPTTSMLYVNLVLYALMLYLSIITICILICVSVDVLCMLWYYYSIVLWYGIMVSLSYIAIFLAPLPPTCPPNKFACDKGKCLQLNLVCNSKKDCDDGSDEEACSGMQSFGYSFHSIF